MTTEPYASARRVFWVVDNGSSHRGQASVDRLENQWRNLRLIHLPIHASWLNQVEIYFSVVQRKVLSPNDFGDLLEVERRLLGFQRRYQQTAVPFDWRYTRADLARLLQRLAEHGAPPKGHDCDSQRWMSSIREYSAAADRSGSVIGGGEKPTGRGFIGGGNQHANTLYLQLRVLSSGIVCRQGCSQAVTAQHADDQFRLCAAGNDRHRHRRAVHDLNSSALYYCPVATTGITVAPWAARRNRGKPWSRGLCNRLVPACFAKGGRS
jgi:hypothetical protein